MVINETQDLDLFPTLLMRIPNFLTDEACDQILDFYRNSEILQPHKYFINNSVSSHSYEHHVNIVYDIARTIQNCDMLEDLIQKAIDAYTNKAGIVKCRMSNSWMNIQNEGGAILRHAHPGSILSGCMYLKANENTNSLYFYTPNPCTTWTPNAFQSRYLSESYEYKPIKGDLILFPSWLQHGTERPNAMDERTIVAFNTCVI